MIPVAPQPEPDDFDASVRRPGLHWLRSKGVPRRGKPPAGVELKPYWRDCLPQLHDAYGGVCAYACVYIERITGAGTVDHFVAKSADAGQAYEWRNYRLACLKMNARKGDFDDVLDPFTLAPGTFVLDLVTGRISPSPRRRAVACRAARQTIDRLRLDDAECRQWRLDWFDSYRNGVISEEHLRRHSPFVWYEARRQNLLRAHVRRHVALTGTHSGT